MAASFDERAACYDGSVRVSFEAPKSQETNPTLNERWLSNYHRRMGR